MAYGSGYGPGYGPGYARAAAPGALSFVGPSISSLSLVVGQAIVERDFSTRFISAEPITFSIVGTLPDGLTLSPEGVLSGTPTQAEVASGLMVRADDGLTTEDSNEFVITTLEENQALVNVLLFQPVARGIRGRKVGQNLVHFRGMAGSPADLGSIADTATSTPFAMPAGARLAFSHSASLSQGDLTVNIGANRAFGHPNLSANQIRKGDWAERGMSISVTNNGAPAGNFKLYVVDLRGNTIQIASAVIP